MSHFGKNIVGVAAAFFLISLLSSANLYAGSNMAAEFSSMQQCLSSIRSATGENLEIVTDKPKRVSGFLSKSRNFFSCELKETGSKGTYYYGYYTTKP